MKTIEEWDENVGVCITWCKEGRINLNKVIRKYNKWLEKHTDNKIKTAKLLVKIETHLKMDYNQDGGSGYREELLKMYDVVNSVLSSN